MANAHENAFWYIVKIGMPTHIRTWSQRFEEFGDIEMKPEEVSLTIQYTNEAKFKNMNTLFL